MSFSSCKSLFQSQLSTQLSASLRVVGYQKKSWCINVPGSKSITNRAIILAALAARPLEIVAPLIADDTYWGFWALENLGFTIDTSHLPNRIGIVPPNAMCKQKSCELYLGQAGTLARFLPAVLLNWQTLYPQSGIQVFKIDGDPQLQRRPLTPLLNALRNLGGNIQSDALPLAIRPSQLEGHCEIDCSVSGQFLSGLLMASAGSRRLCNIRRKNNIVQPDYVRMTLAMLNDFGAEVNYDDEFENFIVFPRELHAPSTYAIEADASTACYFAALACVLGLQLKIENLGSSTLQPDFEFMEILKKFGFSLFWDESTCHVNEGRKPPTSIEGQIIELDLLACSDQAISAGVMALCTGIGVRVTGVAHIRHHESDRILSFCSNCRELGLQVEEFSDGFLVPSGTEVSSLQGKWKTHGDHRFALAGIVLAACAPGVSVMNADCIKKTAPGFVQQLINLGVTFS